MSTASNAYGLTTSSSSSEPSATEYGVLLQKRSAAQWHRETETERQRERAEQSREREREREREIERREFNSSKPLNGQ
jgi:hypothetical protein